MSDISHQHFAPKGFNPPLGGESRSSVGINFRVPQTGLLTCVAQIQNLFAKFQFAALDNFGFSSADLDLVHTIFVTIIRSGEVVRFERVVFADGLVARGDESELHDRPDSGFGAIYDQLQTQGRVLERRADSDSGRRGCRDTHEGRRHGCLYQRCSSVASEEDLDQFLAWTDPRLNPLGADYFNTLGICAISVWRTFLSTAADPREIGSAARRLSLARIAASRAIMFRSCRCPSGVNAIKGERWFNGFGTDFIRPSRTSALINGGRRCRDCDRCRARWTTVCGPAARADRIVRRGPDSRPRRNLLRVFGTRLFTRISAPRTPRSRRRPCASRRPGESPARPAGGGVGVGDDEECDERREFGVDVVREADDPRVSHGNLEEPRAASVQ
jgi:hypothetical protein